MGGRREVPRHGGASTMYGKAKGNGNITEKSIINAERVENEYEYVCALLSLAICVCIDLDSYTYSYQFIPLSYWSTFSYYALLRHVSTYINALCAGWWCWALPLHGFPFQSPLHIIIISDLFALWIWHILVVVVTTMATATAAANNSLRAATFYFIIQIYIY